MKLKNRIIRVSTSLEMYDDYGGQTQELLNVYDKSANDGSSLIVSVMAYVMKQD